VSIFNPAVNKFFVLEQYLCRKQQQYRITPAYPAYTAIIKKKIEKKNKL